MATITAAMLSSGLTLLDSMKSWWRKSTVMTGKFLSIQLWLPLDEPPTGMPASPTARPWHRC